MSYASRYFPNILFCKAAKKQLKKFSGKEKYFKEIIRHLNIFNQEKDSNILF
jgi:hypothetical protein